MKLKTLMRGERGSLWLENKTCNGAGEPSSDHEPPRRKEYVAVPSESDEQLVPTVAGESQGVKKEPGEYRDYEEPRRGDHGGLAAYPPRGDSQFFEELEYPEPSHPGDHSHQYQARVEELLQRTRDYVQLQRMSQFYQQAAAMQMGLLPYPYPFVVGAPDMYARTLSTPMVLPSPSHPLYRPTPQASPNTELSNVSSEFYDDESLENESPVQERVQPPQDSPVYPSVRSDSLPAYHDGRYIKQESTEDAQPEASALPQEIRLPMASPNFMNSLVAGSPWRPVPDSIGVQVKEEERSPVIGPLRRTRASTRAKRTSAVSLDELDEESKVSDRGYFPRYYECGACNLRMRSHQGLNKHFSSHGSNLPHLPAVCAICRQALPNAFELDNHVRTHDDAGKELLQRRRAERGVRRRHECPHCGKSLAKRDSLVEHMRIHTGEKPYTCEHCQESFRSWSMYWEHIRRHRGMKYKCATCKMEFKDQFYLQMHSCSLNVMLKG
ncbi:zinc finger and SCAN domain-containing protein 31-like [Penaeus chinensis]|uniref:zinc finger and SCAN domain-containing protein 31-like n=1 Tax=Penaeus chinensis TaxID=139456 RepID=UPI001FB854B9|nr:zinc finger and SCAN domain-containing protein 31-like [Penaeus chinensis]